MNNTSTMCLETACIAGLSPLGADAAARLSRARRISGRPAARTASDADERFVEELLATFGDRWEW